MAAFYKYLRFFDKTGSPLNFLYDEATDSWTGSVFFDRVSVDLYENQHVFILESVLTGSPLSTDYTFPILGQQVLPVKSEWGTKWTNDDSEAQIFTYVVVEDSNNVPFIQDFEEIAFSNSAVSYTQSSPSEQKIIGAVNSTALKINIAFTSDTEYIYERTLIIEDRSFATPKVVATILFHGETIGEDDRFALMLENFGRTFNQKDALIVNDVDITEPLPNWIKVNEKRKELLLTGEDIYPYIGSYKGLVNVVKFFGYHEDLRIKEYWLNIDKNSENYNKIQQFELTDLFTDQFNPLIKHPLIPNTQFKKTSMFGLFYDITVATGDVDEFGTPITKNASTFTPEEVIVKLFALKDKLKKEFLPLNARIVDIVGEGIYFERYGLRSWTDDLLTFDAEVGVDIEFDSEPRLGYIRDLRKFQVKRFSPGLNLPVDRFTNLINPYTMGQAYPDYAVPGLLDSIRAFYAELRKFIFPYTGEKSVFIGDEPGIVAGCPVILKGKANQFTWDDMVMSWDSVDIPLSPQVSPLYTWDTIDFSNFYEIEWTIEKPAPNPYSFSFRGPVAEYYQLPHFLPYAGKYKITMTLYDLYNTPSLEIKDQWMEVLNREVEIGAFCRFRNLDEYTWGIDETWDDLSGSTWHFPIEGVSRYSSPLHEKLTQWARYQNQDDALILDPATGNYLSLPLAIETVPNARRFGTHRTINWENMKVSWDEMYHSSWDMYDYHSDFLGGFRIFNPEIGDGIQIDDYPVFLFTDLSPSIAPLDLFEAAAQLNASTNLGILKFTYTVRFVAASPQDSFIHAVAKFAGPEGWHFIEYFQSSPGSISGDPYSFTKPTWLDYQFDSQVFAINGASNTTPIVITTSTANPFVDGQSVKVEGVLGNTAANGTWTVSTVVPGTSVTLIGSIGNGVYSAGTGSAHVISIAEQIENITNPITPIDENLLFLDIPVLDLVQADLSPLTVPNAGTVEYWQQHGYLKTEDPTPDFPFGERRGELPSWKGSGSFNNGDLRLFRDEFTVPLGVPVFLVNLHSEIPGKHDQRWVITNEITGELVIDVKGVPFVIFNFIEESIYTVESYVTDSNGNDSYAKKKGFIKVSSRENMSKSFIQPEHAL